MKKSIVLCSLITALGIFYSCKKNYEPGVSGGTAYLDLPATPYNYYPFFGDSIKMNKAASLGRVLFYDKHLSVNNSVACASCHKQALAFSDNVAFSRGFENRLTGRNSMPIQNLKKLVLVVPVLYYFGTAANELPALWLHAPLPTM